MRMVRRAALWAICAAPLLAGCTHSVRGPAADGVTVVAAVRSSALRDAFQAGAAAAKQARAALGAERVRCALVFDSFPAGQRAALLAGIGSHVDAAVVFGCPASMPLSSQATDTDPRVVLLALGGRGLSTAAARTETREKSDLRLAGGSLARALPAAREDNLLVLLGDFGSPRGAEVLDGLKGVRGTNGTVVGAPVSAAAPAAYFQGQAVDGTVIAVALGGTLKVGCAAASAGGPSKQTEEAVLGSARAAARPLFDQTGRAPLFVLAFSALERRAALKDPRAEVAEVARVFGAGVPVVGFYGAGQIGAPTTAMPALALERHIVLCAVWPE